MDYREKLDYSSLSTYQSCPRKFLFQYVMNLRSPHKSIHLVFGSCWHYGLEVSYNTLKDNPNLTVIDLAIISSKAFNRLWEIEGKPHFPNEEVIFPKSPGHAANMFKGYWERFLPLIKNHKIISVETSFVIDLGMFEKNLPNYIGRMDLLLEDKNSTLVIVDHKTAKAIYSTAAAGFESSYQTDGYLAAGRIYYNKIPSMVYHVALCQKSKIGFEIFTINKRTSAIDHFLADLVFYAKEIIHSLNMLQEDIKNLTSRTDTLNCFHRCSGYSCTTFASVCGYYDLCKIRNNPLLWLEKPPQGYIIEKWDPDTHDAEIKRKLKEVA